jgi:hypothetical protein
MSDDLDAAAEDFGADFGDAIAAILDRAHSEAWLDGLALIAALWDDDPARGEQVMMMMDEPALVAAKLANVIAQALRAAGTPRTWLAEQQRRTALGESDDVG